MRTLMRAWARTVALWLRQQGNPILVGLIVTIVGGLAVVFFVNFLPSIVSAVIPYVAPTPASPWNCIGDIYNCSDFSSCAQVMSYWNVCPGDPSRLDADNDGIPCEVLCRSESYTPSPVEPGFLSLRASSPTGLVGPVPVTLIGPLEEAPPRVVEYMLPEYGWIIDTLPAVGTYEIIFSHPESGATVCDYEVWLDPAIPQSIGCYSELWAFGLE